MLPVKIVCGTVEVTLFGHYVTVTNNGELCTLTAQRSAESTEMWKNLRMAWRAATEAMIELSHVRMPVAQYRSTVTPLGVSVHRLS